MIVRISRHHALVLAAIAIFITGCEEGHYEQPVFPIPWDSVTYNNIDSALLRPDKVERFIHNYDTSKVLPIALTRFPRLRDLTWWYGRLTQVPSFIGDLQSLQELSLASNKITYVAPEIGKLSSLRELGLSDNQITRLPNEICNLHELSHMYIYNNKLTSLPDSIHKLTKLRELWMRGNMMSMQEIQRIRTALPKLEWFSHD